MSIHNERLQEVRKYRNSYTDPSYKMGSARLSIAAELLIEIPLVYKNGTRQRGSLLDVGTGRGELMTIARAAGFNPVAGTEVVGELAGGEVTLAYAHNLPFDDGAFDAVTMFDVLEHLLPEDTESALDELDRVSRHCVIVSAADFPSTHMGEDLHINRHDYDEWDEIIRQHLKGDVQRINYPKRCPSQFWTAYK